MYLFLVFVCLSYVLREKGGRYNKNIVNLSVSVPNLHVYPSFGCNGLCIYSLVNQSLWRILSFSFSAS